jgi:drug/metabolite transporter (DMT)-like permease
MEHEERLLQFPRGNLFTTVAAANRSCRGFQQVLGVGLAALSAASFAFNNASTRRGVLTGSVSQAMAITVPIGVPIFFLVTLATDNLEALGTFSPQAIQTMALVGLLHFVCGRYCNYRAVKALGANLSAPIIQLYLVATLGLAVVILGETLTPLRILGTILIVLGPALVRQANARTSADTAASGDATLPDSESLPAFQPHYAEGYVFGLLAAVAYGVTPILIRLVVERRGLGGSLAAGLISYTAATVVITLIALWPGQWRHILAMDPRSLRWFTSSGVFVCLSQMFLCMALAVAPVSLVIPILQIQLILRFVFARIMNPQHEIFGGQMVLATAASLLGAVAISLSTEFLIALAPLPGWMIDILRWQWPA